MSTHMATDWYEYDKVKYFIYYIYYKKITYFLQIDIDFDILFPNKILNLKTGWNLLIQHLEIVCTQIIKDKKKFEKFNQFPNDIGIICFDLIFCYIVIIFVYILLSF